MSYEWLAGYLEGEGYFGIRTTPAGNPCWIITAGSTDRDVLEKVQAITGVGNIRPQKSPEGSKPMWTWTISKRPIVASILKQILPYMGARRQAKIQLMLDGIASRVPTAGDR